MAISDIVKNAGERTAAYGGQCLGARGGDGAERGRLSRSRDAERRTTMYGASGYDEIIGADADLATLMYLVRRRTS